VGFLYFAASSEGGGKWANREKGGAENMYYNSHYCVGKKKRLVFIVEKKGRAVRSLYPGAARSQRGENHTAQNEGLGGRFHNDREINREAA